MGARRRRAPRAEPLPASSAEPIRERKRTQRLPSALDDEEKQSGIAHRVTKFFEDDNDARTEDLDLRLQRYAKFRQWTEGGKTFPWDDASDAAIPDMMTESLRMQDTLHNAVLSARPTVVAKKIAEKPDPENHIDDLLDFQFFVENEGEKVIEEMTEAFVNDGGFVVFTPWVRERRKHSELRIFGRIPEDQAAQLYFQSLLEQMFPKGSHSRTSEDGWDWTVSLPDEQEKPGDRVVVRFYTNVRKEVEVEIEHRAKVFDGPRPMVVDYEDVVTPPGSANLQVPGPSNPLGAPHVILKSRPTKDEIRQLIHSGFYDLAPEDALELIENAATDQDDRALARQRDQLAGQNEDRAMTDKWHERLTRLVCFDRIDIDGDGEAEDVVFWVLKEPRMLLKWAPMGELYPSNPARRPFAEAQFLPVKGKREGISLLEIMEGLHDSTKELFDQMVDSGTLTLSPIGFFRATSNIKPEPMRVGPGDLMPLSDPSRDINFPTIGNTAGMGFGFNAIAVLQQWMERLTLMGDLQFGRVPTGKASALRTVGGVQTILGQGEARPERILRRFFMGLTEVFRQMHELNRHFMSDRKTILLLNTTDKAANPYLEVKRDDLNGRYQFDFQANVLNSSRQAIQAGLEAMIGLYVGALPLQLGISTPDTIYRLLRDWGRSKGQDPDRYLNPPSPAANKPMLNAEEAILMIMQDRLPDGLPLEGAQDHLAKLQAFINDERFGVLTTDQVEMFRIWIKGMAQLANQQAQAEQLAQAGNELSAAAQQGGEPPGTLGLSSGPTPISGGAELLDETLPTARGAGPDGNGFAQ